MECRFREGRDMFSFIRKQTCFSKAGGQFYIPTTDEGFSYFMGSPTFGVVSHQHKIVLAILMDV